MPEADSLQSSIVSIAAAYGLPPDLDVATAVGSDGSCWRVESPSTGNSWHVRRWPAERERRDAYQDGRRLAALARRAGLPVAESLQPRVEDPGSSGASVPEVVIRPWLAGQDLARPSPGVGPGDLADWLGAVVAGLHALWPLAQVNDDAMRLRYGLYPLEAWERRFNKAEDADLAWTALAPDALPVIEEASRLVAAGLRIRDLQPVVTHRHVVPRHVIVGEGITTLIDPFDAGPDFAWLETVDAAVAFGEAGAGVLEAARRKGETAGPLIPEALARTFGRDLAELTTAMSNSLRQSADDELTARQAIRIGETLDRVTSHVESIEEMSQRVLR